MKRRNFIDSAGKAALMAAAINGSSVKEMAQNNRHPVGAPEERAEYLAKMLKALCTDLGPHPIGSPEYDEAALIVKKEMELSLPIVELDTFNYERWVMRSEPEFYVGDRWLEACPSHGSSGTSSEGITGTLRKIDDDGGIPYGVTDISSGEIKAYVTFAPRGNARPRSYYSYNRKPKCPPIFIVGKQDVPVLENAVENEIPVRLNVEVDFIPDTPTSNVVGTLPGESKDEIVFIAHLDTVYTSPGANDNTATVIVMLMWAHALAGTQPKKTLTFIATTGEEYNKLGAINYVEKRKREGTLQNIKFVFNFDSFTWGPNLINYSKDEELISLVHELNRKYNKKGVPEPGEGDGFWLDARPFRETGARALSISSVGYDVADFCWHRPEDIPENVPVELAEIGFLIFNEFIKRVQDM